jgi:hypothetical protein
LITWKRSVSFGRCWTWRRGRVGNYKSEHASHNVPQHSESHKQLGSWAGEQRWHYKEKKLSQETINKLEEIAFVWVMAEKKKWEDRYAELVNYKSECGQRACCNVPMTSKSHKQLAGWVRTHRWHYKEKKLLPEKIDKLKEIGFVWVMADRSWEDRYTELVNYKREHGDCNVPINSKSYKQLASWVRTQRKQCKEKKL